MNDFFSALQLMVGDANVLLAKGEIWHGLKELRKGNTGYSLLGAQSTAFLAFPSIKAAIG